MIELSVHDEPLTVDADGVPRIGCRTLRIRDQYGRELPCEFMAWGKVAPAIAQAFGSAVEVVGSPQPDEAIVSNARLDAAGEYLVIVVKAGDAVRE